MTLPPSTQRFLDAIENAEPITSARLIALVAATALAWADNVLHFSADPVLTFLAVSAAVPLVTWLWERGQVWSQRSHIAEVSQAYSDGIIDGQPQPPNQPPGA